MAGRQANLGAKVLDTDGRQVGRHDDPNQFVAVLGVAGEVWWQNSQIDVGDRGHERGTEQARYAADPAAAESGEA